MTQNNPPGYPLPDGELGDDDLVCQLIYLPDRAEYWQALLGAIHYMSTWRAWERDDDKRGKDAAANWRAAFELTIGCWRMTCLEELTQTVTDILELLQTKKDCCDDNITYLPVDDIETDIDPGVGDSPEYYGETEIADWDEWAEHVCYNAHAYVDYLAHAGDSIWDSAKSSSIGIGLIAALLTLLAFSGIGLPIAYGLAAGIVSGIVLGGQIATFAGTREAIEDARNDIVCAILQGTSLSEAVEDALESGLDWDLFYQFIPYESAMAIIYEGGHDSEFLPAETRDDCDCEEPKETPPGYHLEYPSGQPSLIDWHENCESESVNYDDEDGILKIDFTTGSAIQFSIKVHWPVGLFGHGYVFEVMDYIGPSDVKNTYEQADDLIPQNYGIEETIAGYKTNAHSGQDWDDFVAQYDNTDNFTVGQPGVFVVEIPNQSATPFTQYRLWIKIEYLVPD